MNFLKALFFIFKYRKALAYIKDELWYFKVESQKALVDHKLEKQELLDILRGHDNFFEKLIEIIENS